MRGFAPDLEKYHKQEDLREPTVISPPEIILQNKIKKATTQPRAWSPKTPNSSAAMEKEDPQRIAFSIDASSASDVW